MLEALEEDVLAYIDCEGEKKHNLAIVEIVAVTASD